MPMEASDDAQPQPMTGLTQDLSDMHVVDTHADACMNRFAPAGLSLWAVSLAGGTAADGTNSAPCPFHDAWPQLFSLWYEDAILWEFELVQAAQADAHQNQISIGVVG